MSQIADPNWQAHHKFVLAYVDDQAARCRKGDVVHRETQLKWNELKNGGKVDLEVVAEKIREWKSATEALKKKNSVLNYFSKRALTASSSTLTAPSTSTTQAAPSSPAPTGTVANESSEEDEQDDPASFKRPKQEELEKEIRELDEEITVRQALRSEEQRKGVKQLTDLKKSKEAKLKRLQINQRAQRKWRDGAKSKAALRKIWPIIIGEARQPYDIEVKGSTLYARQLSRKAAIHEGKRHHQCVPVRMLRPQNDQISKHADGHFCSATIAQMKDFATLMSSKAVFFLSQDDKARVPLGIPAVNKQVRMAMHLQYRGRLPHHDWVVAERHKLIPGVYAACAISKEKVPYVGPTYVAIRSGKHDHSSAASHFADFTELVDLESFRDLSRTSTGKLKPILLVTVDGGHDESPRFPKTLRAWASVFMQFDLDYTMVATHAPGQSAYNAVERRMAPVLKELAGVILPYDNSEIFLRFCAKQ